ncbi:hypothetical protein PG996_008792 [Apiospora saccharicola]|uniref:Uncharacterized protein n=1 Tax=Apiospora saccharicola TaxID=335842 RepID=A0ABR1UYX7_9PEZI
MKIIRQLLIALVSIATLGWAVSGSDAANDDSTSAGGGIKSTNDPAKAEPAALKLAELGQCPTQPKISCWATECRGYGLGYECRNVEAVRLGQQEDAALVILAGCPCCNFAEHTWCRNLDCQALPGTAVCREGTEQAGCPCMTQEELEE